MASKRVEVPGYKGGFVIDMSDVEVDTMPRLHTRNMRDTPLEKRQIIAWDGEGMKLSGPDKPQHYTVFGCSMEPEWVLISQNLKCMEILEYIISVGERYPNAVHIGYGFRYDTNMIVKSLPEKHLRTLKHKGEVTFTLGDIKWRIHMIPGKSIRVTKRWSEGKNNTGKRSGDGYISVKIDDMVSFFACPFLDACESILKKELSPEDREVIRYGKESRKDNAWDDLDSVRYYWEREIFLMQRMAEVFRDVMFNAGLRLKDWYGPGAIATYLIRTKKLRNHIQNTPEIREVHEASKIAYAGGRFELFRVGRIQGPVYGLDINSAYPYALSNAPSLGLDHGEWVYVSRPSTIEEFGVYRITYRHGGKPRAIERLPMPLFHRDRQGSISFPQTVQGWYWSPEARAAKFIGNKFPGSVEIHEGWVWRHDGTRPFKFLEEMFQERLRLGKHNVVSMPYKLGPNSMYGKLAQRVGWDEKNKLPPRSHCLPLAGWITSSCRASLFRVMAQMPVHRVIAVETDGIYTTMNPDDLSIRIGEALGEFGVDEYREMLYLQNGIYHQNKDGEWEKPKARGLDIASVSRDIMTEYFQRCGVGTEPRSKTDFPLLKVKTRERFIGLNAAYARVFTPNGDQRLGRSIKDHLGKWEEGKREIIPGGKGKRMHFPDACPECISGFSPWDQAHSLVIRSRSMGEMSTPHSLPWENDKTPDEMQWARELDIEAEDMIPLEYT